MATLLRKLTEKSKFKFGKYTDLTVQEVMNLKHFNYIRWVYFNMSNISFMDNILEEVKISEDYRINKPGKNPELGEELNNSIFNKMSGLSKYIYDKKEAKKYNAKLVQHKARDSKRYSKSSLTRYNHGHTN